MKVSIITVVYNGEKTIRQTLESVVSQDYPEIEYIVIDGNSNDLTVSIIKSFGAGIHTFVSEPDSGIYDAMNKGIKLATGEIVGIINADDFYNSPRTISNIVEKFYETNADAVYGDLVYVDQENTEIIKRNWKSGLYRHNNFLWGWMPPHPTFFIRKSWYDNFGGFRMDLNSAADYELMLRMVHKHQAKLVYLEDVIVKMRVGGISNSSFRNRVIANKNDRRAWKVNNIKPYAFTTVLKPLRKLLQFIP